MKGKRIASPKRPNGWVGSAEQRAVAIAAIRAWNRQRHAAPKCAALRKRDHLQCQQIAMGNGRCYLHGGRTPSGSGWHRMQPAATAEKTEHKIADHQRTAAKRRKKLANMTPERQAAHDAWQRSHEPGSSAARAARRRERQENAEARKIIFEAGATAALSPEAAELAARLAGLQSQVEGQNETQAIGVFA